MNYGKMNINMEHKKKIRDGFNPKASILFFSSLPSLPPFPFPPYPSYAFFFPFPILACASQTAHFSKPSPPPED